MSGRLLSDAERRRFATWLREDASSNELIVEGFKKLPSLSPSLSSALVESRERLIAAELLVADRLDRR